MEFEQPISNQIVGLTTFFNKLLTFQLTFFNKLTFFQQTCNFSANMRRLRTSLSMVLRVYFAMNISSIGVVLLKQDQLLLLNDQITLRIIIF